MKYDPFTGCFCNQEGSVWPSMSFLDHLLQMAKMSIEIVILVKKCSKIRNEVTGFFVRRSQYNLMCVLGDYFGPIRRNAFRNLNSCPKACRKCGRQHSHQKHIKIIYDLSPLCFHCLEREIYPHVCFGGSFFASNGRNTFRNLNNCPKPTQETWQIKIK